jgi:hypothetical protein
VLIDTVMESPEEADFAADRADDPGTTRTDGKGLCKEAEGAETVSTQW